MFSSVSGFMLYKTRRHKNLLNGLYEIMLVQSRNHENCPNLLKGIDFIRNPRLNKGLAFTLEERQALGIHGLLGARFKTQKEQLEMCQMSIDRYQDDLNKYIYLVELEERNQKLFFSLLATDVEKYMPIVYTPTVGKACQRFGLLYRRSRGLFITIHDKGHVISVLKNWPREDIKAIVFTDGERILGLGDLGAYGMGIPVGKLALYTALAGIQPQQCLPVVLDVGTDNPTLLEDPLYIGLRQKRVRGQEYDDFIDEFIKACRSRFGSNTLLQFEDFALANATRLLEKYRNICCTFNDDIQGTASVAVGGLMAATRVTKKSLKENIYFFLGAGSAATGIANLVTLAMMEEGVDIKEARKKVFMFDVKGLLAKPRSDDVPEAARIFIQDVPPESDFEKCIATVKPTCLIGCSTVGGAFTPSVLKQMSKNTERPIIFALSNPTSQAECTAQAAYDNTEGRCVFASGSPFPPVQYKGKTYTTGQGNNAYVFPGIALGVICCGAHNIPEPIFLEASRSLAKYVAESDLESGRVYPKLSQVMEVSKAIALDVIETAYKEGVATLFPRPKDMASFINNYVFNFEYESALPAFYKYPAPPGDIKVKSMEEIYKVLVPPPGGHSMK